MSAVVEVGFVRGWNSLFDVLGEYLPPIFLGGSAEGVARKHRSNKCKRFKTKAGFGEGTPQQVRPVSEMQFQFLKLWPQVDTCLSLFSSKMKIQLSNWISVSNAGSASYNRSVSCLWSPLALNLRSCPCVAAALSGSPAFCAGSWRGIQIQTAHIIFKVQV